MTISYPRDFPPYLLGAMKLEIIRNDITVRDGMGHLSGGSLGTDLWMFSGEFPALGDTAAVQLEAWIASMDGSGQRFQAQDRRRRRPVAHDATSFAAMTKTASGFTCDATGREVELTGMDTGTTLTVGDMLGFKGGPSNAYRHAVRVVAGDVATGDGKLNIEVRPTVWPVVQAWTSVAAHLDTPSITMRLLWPETQIGDTSPEGFMTARIVAMQDLPEDDS